MPLKRLLTIPVVTVGIFTAFAAARAQSPMAPAEGVMQRLVHEYGNRDWAGLTNDYYLPRWQMYLDSLSTPLVTGNAPKSIDWYAFGDHWSHSQKVYDTNPKGDSYQAALVIARTLDLLPNHLDKPVQVNQ